MVAKPTIRKYIVNVMRPLLRDTRSRKRWPDETMHILASDPEGVDSDDLHSRPSAPRRNHPDHFGSSERVIAVAAAMNKVNGWLADYPMGCQR